jgi:hypothetical protein
VSSGSGVTSSSTVLDDNAVPLTTYPFGGEPVVVGPAAANHRTVEPRSVTLVENAFHSTGADSWSVTVEGTNTIVKVDGDTWVHDTVVLPASVCAEI